jgi:hypothetical protein
MESNARKENNFLVKNWQNYERIKTYIKEDNIAIGISIVQINAIKSLRKLDIACLLSISGIHHETHCFFKSFAIIEIVITINIQKICTIGQDSRNSNLHCTR